MLARDGQSKSDFERRLQERREIPLYAAVDKYKEFEQTLDKMLQDPAVRDRTNHLAALLMRGSSIGEEKGGAASTEVPNLASQHIPLVRAFHEKFVEGMRRTSSSILPKELRDERGIPIDRSKVVNYTDLKVAILRKVVRDAFEQLLQRPGDPTKDQLLVDKILSLASADGLSSTEGLSIRGPAIRAVVSAFADVISSPAFATPANLSLVQEKLLNGLLRPPAPPEDKSGGLVSVVMDEAWYAALTARRTFIRGEYDGKLPQDLLGVKLQDAEKAVLSVVESMSLIASAVSPPRVDSERIDFAAHAFGEDRTAWAIRHIPTEIVQVIQIFLNREDIEQVVHRAHNIASNPLASLLSQAFERRGLPRAVWPNP